MDPDTDVMPPPSDFGDDEPPLAEDVVGQEDDLTGDHGVVKKILVVGSGLHPEAGSDVTVHYVGKLLDGTVFDSSRDRNEPFKFNLGKGEVIQGWDKAVAKMRPGETSLITIAPQYAYGDRDQGKIPPNSTLQFEVELLSAVSEKDISKDFSKSLLLKQTKKAESNEWENPAFESLVTFTANCLSGNAQSYDNATVTIGCDQVAEKALRRALRKMAKGEEALITAKANTKYNEGPTDQVWQVTLSSFEKAPASWSMEGDQKISKATELKDKGNEYYKVQNFKLSARFYKHALEFVNSEYKLDADQKVAANKLKSVIASNHAAVALHGRDWDKARELATTAITADPSNIKAFLRRGKALNELDRWEEARKDLNQAVSLAQEKDDKISLKDAKAELAKIAAKDRAKFQKEQKLFGGLFEKMRPLEEAEEKARAAQKAAVAAQLEKERQEREAKEKEAAPKDTPMGDAAAPSEDTKTD